MSNRRKRVEELKALLTRAREMLRAYRNAEASDLECDELVAEIDEAMT